MMESLPPTPQKTALFSEPHFLWMAVPKRNKSARMKRFERNKPWKVGKQNYFY